MSVRLQLLLPGLFISLLVQSQEYLHDYSFFTNSRMSGNYFFSQTKATGSSSIENENNRLLVDETLFHTPGNSIRLQYRNQKDGSWQANIFRPDLRGQDFFKKSNFLSFWIYTASASTQTKDLPVIRLIKKDSTFTNEFSITAATENAWSQIIIPLNFFKKINGEKPQETIGVSFSQGKTNDDNSHTVYVDDIEFITAQTSPAIAEKPAISNAKGYARHVTVQWQPIKDDAVKYVQIYRSEDGGVKYTPVGIQTTLINRFVDFTGQPVRKYEYKISFIGNDYKETGLSEPVTAYTKQMSDNEMLGMVQEACFQYYWEGAEANSGLAVENIPGRRDMIASGASGFGIMALIVGTERKFITREQSVERFLKIVSFLDRASTFHGAFSHFIDGPTARVEPFFGKSDNGGDLVETSFLMQGLLAARAYFNTNDAKEKTIRDKITAIWKKVEWDWYRRYADSKFLYWHWSPDQAWIVNHRLIGWNEVMVTYLLAIASPTHAVPASMYYTGWANQDSTGQQYRSGWGGTTEGSMYTNGNSYYGIKLDVGVSNGGPLFFTHYSYMGYDPHQVNDKYTNYFINNQNIARINYLYCVDNPKKYKAYGDSCWGLTASDGPYGYSADEPVVRQDRGKIAPTGAISSFPYTPVASMKALKRYYNIYGKFLWGEYGFRDAFNLTENWCSEIYMGLNQAPMTVMIENYRTELLWRLFMSNPEIKAGLKKLETETRSLK
jgi:hypothetical protein